MYESEKIKVLKEQLSDEFEYEPIDKIRKMNMLRELLFYTHDIVESDKLAKELIIIGTQYMEFVDFSQKLEIYHVLRTNYIHLAPRDFHSYMIALEWDREPKDRFYQPRMRVFRSVADEMTKLMNDELDILTLSMPPGVGKSTLGIFFLSWIIGNQPELCNLASAYADKLTKSFYIGVLSIYENDEYNYHEIFPNVNIVGQNSKDEWMDFTNKGRKVPNRFPSLTCRSIDGSLTGATRCEGILYSDDLVSGIEEAMNLDRLQKLWDKYGTDLKSRKKKNCKEIHIATRWSVHDPIGRLEMMNDGNPRFKSIILPALDENGESNFDYDYDVGFDSKYFESARETLDEISFLCLYQQQPIEREGILFYESELKRYSVLPSKEPDKIFAFNDVAFGGEDSLSMPIAYLYDDEVYIEDIVFLKGDYKITEPLVAAKIVQHKCHQVVFESNNGGDFYARDIEKLVKEMGYKCNITDQRAPSNMSKLARIIQHAPAVKEFYFKDKSMYSSNSMYGKFMRELTTFVQNGKSKHDDAPDSICSLANMIRKKPYAEIVVVKTGRKYI